MFFVCCYIFFSVFILCAHCPVSLSVIVWVNQWKLMLDWKLCIDWFGFFSHNEYIYYIYTGKKKIHNSMQFTHSISSTGWFCMCKSLIRRVISPTENVHPKIMCIILCDAFFHIVNLLMGHEIQNEHFIAKWSKRAMKSTTEKKPMRMCVCVSVRVFFIRRQSDRFVILLSHISTSHEIF